MGDRIRIWPRFVQTIGAMRDHQVDVKAICTTCGTSFRVNLVLMCAMNGRGYSLIDKRGKCKVYDCPGSCVFLYRTGSGTPFLPLIDR